MAAYTPPKVGTARWLSANGHPGYSQATARKVAELQARFPGLSFHAAIYGGRELALRIEAARSCPAFSPGGEYCPWCGKHVGEYGWMRDHTPKPK